MKKIMASLAAAGLLVAGGATYAIVAAPAAATAQDETTTEDGTTDDGLNEDGTTDSSTTDAPERVGLGDLLTSVLERLVTDGTITQDQADAVAGAVETEIDETRAAFEEWREANPGFRDRGHRGHRGGFDVGALLEDGVIDADELATLPEDHPLLADDGPLADALADGEVTQEELDAARDSFGDGHRFGRGGSDDADDSTDTDDTDGVESGLTF